MLRNHFVILTVLLSFIAECLGDVIFKTPKDGSSYSGSSGEVEIKTTWKDDLDDEDEPLSLHNVKFHTISLCYYENDYDFTCFSDSSLVKKKKIPSNEINVKFDRDYVPNGYYFLQIYTEYKQGNTIKYSTSFKLTGMTGPSSITATVSKGGPYPQWYIDPAATSINSAWFSITYTKQTGKTRYAPMQLQPKTTVTHSKWSRRFATSAYTPYSTLRPSPNVKSTITPGWSYKPSSARNTAATAAYPSSFYAASSRVSKATLSAASKAKRWV